MNTTLLRAATDRRLGFRRWRLDGGEVTVSAPSRNNFGWFYLGWTVPSGKRGLDYLRHKGLARGTGLSRGVALDLARGTNNTGIRAAL